MTDRIGHDSDFGGGLFRPLTLIILLVVGLFAFGAYISLSGFVDEMKKSDNGRSHAMSKSPNGFAGIVQLMRSQDTQVYTLRNDIPYRQEALTIYTLPSTNVAGGIEKIDFDVPTLIVLPKWNTFSALSKKQVYRGDAYSVKDIENAIIDVDEDLFVSREVGTRKVTIRPDDVSKTRTYLDRTRLKYTIPDVTSLQTMESESLIPLLTAGNGIILGRLESTDTYILSDPDLMNNNGIKSFATAELSLDMIDMTRFSDDEVYFDLVLHGLATRSNLVKTALTPPFLSATLCLIALGILISWRAFTRFGAPQPTQRVYALGKEALAENSADLIKMTKRQVNMAMPYSAYMLSSTADRLSMPPNTAEEELVRRFDKHSETQRTTLKFSEILNSVRSSKTTLDLETYAQNYQIWTKEITRGH